MASNNEKLLDTVGQAFRAELPEFSSMDEYLDFLIPKVRPWGEDLREEKHYVNRAWLEFQDDDQFHDIVLHFFNEEGEYLRSENGDVSTGHWRYLESANKFLIDHGDTELYDLAYMDKNFFILKKHGEQERFGKAKYFVLAHEPLAKAGMERPHGLAVQYLSQQQPVLFRPGVDRFIRSSPYPDFIGGIIVTRTPSLTLAGLPDSG